VIRRLSLLCAITTVASCSADAASGSGDCPRGVEIAPGDCLDLQDADAGALVLDDAGADDAGDGGPR
jgi:hypothetical protein